MIEIMALLSMKRVTRYIPIHEMNIFFRLGDEVTLNIGGTRDVIAIIQREL